MIISRESMKEVGKEIDEETKMGGREGKQEWGMEKKVETFLIAHKYIFILIYRDIIYNTYNDTHLTHVLCYLHIYNRITGYNRINIYNSF